MTTTVSNLSAGVRAKFPALRRTLSGMPVAYFDGPGGTQVPQSVADAVADHLVHHNANDGWAFASSRETDATLAGARASVAAFIGAASPGEILFGANMTTLTFSLARAVGRSLQAGDEIVVTELDHHANVDPWVALARDCGAVVRRIPLIANTPQLDFAAFERLLGPRTRVVALGVSSNAFGTRNPVAEYARAAHAAGALVFVDAVHAAAHESLDVTALGADMLAFSAYKVYGPHVGIVYCRDELLARLDVPRVEPQLPVGSKRAESGTQNHEGIAGVTAALAFLAELGPPNAAPQPRFAAALAALAASEEPVFEELVAGLRALPNVTLYEPPPEVARHPTVAFSVRGRGAGDVALELSERHALFVSHGNFYASRAVAKVAPATDRAGGVLRAGVSVYTPTHAGQRLGAAVAGLRD